MVQKALTGAAEEIGKLRPGIRGTHIDDPHRLDPWLWRLDAKEARGLAALNAAPELSLGRNSEMLLRARHWLDPWLDRVGPVITFNYVPGTMGVTGTEASKRRIAAYGIAG